MNNYIIAFSLILQALATNTFAQGQNRSGDSSGLEGNNVTEERVVLFLAEVDDGSGRQVMIDGPRYINLREDKLTSFQKTFLRFYFGQPNNMTEYPIEDVTTKKSNAYLIQAAGRFETHLEFEKYYQITDIVALDGPV